MNVETKKQNGVVFTPEWVADFMTDETLNTQLKQINWFIKKSAVN